MMEQPGFIRDDFAAGGGWSVALRWLGLSEVGVENEPLAVATARAAGHKRWLADVTCDAVRDFPWPKMWLYIASPPCQTFSAAGKGDGRKHFASLIAAMRLVAEGYTPQDAIEMVSDEALDIRSVLVLEPLLVIREHLPTMVALEQVPQVLPIWEVYAEILREWGYYVWTGHLTSEMYGVPQTRKRAILMAHRDHPVDPPPPTHSRFYTRDKKRMDPGVLPWVSMADALGWGMTERPSMTVTGGGTDAGGAEPFGNGARKGMIRELEEGRYVQRSNYSGAGSPGATAEERGRTIRSLDEPSVTLTSKGFQWQFAGAGATSEQTAGQIPRDAHEPAHTITGKGTAAWKLRNNTSENAGVRDADEPAPTIYFGERVNKMTWEPVAANEGTTAEDMAWVHERPAPTVVGSFAPDVMAKPAYRKPGDGPRQRAKGSVRVTLEEASTLQSFPVGYPWQGNSGQKHQQVGNAIPPLLALAILRHLTS